MLYKRIAELERKVHTLMVDFTRLDGDVTQALALVKQLQAQIAAIPPSTDPQTQAHIDLLAATIEAALPAAPNPVPSPTGATGP